MDEHELCHRAVSSVCITKPGPAPYAHEHGPGPTYKPEPTPASYAHEHGPRPALIYKPGHAPTSYAYEHGHGPGPGPAPTYEP